MLCPSLESDVAAGAGRQVNFIYKDIKIYGITIIKIRITSPYIRCKSEVQENKVTTTIFLSFMCYKLTLQKKNSCDIT